MKRGLKSFTVIAVFCGLASLTAQGQFTTNNFFNWETPPVHPVALSPDGTRLAVCNLSDDHVEIFDVTSGTPVSLASIAVGINPVSVCFRTTNELWVANYISSTLSVIDLGTMRVFNTINTTNQPSDIVFAGSPQQAYVSCGQPNVVQVFNPLNSQLLSNLTIDGNRPRSMTVSPNGGTVYVAIFESGNASTIIDSGIPDLNDFPRPNAIEFPDAPSHGLDPPPNNGTNFVPAINPVLPAPPRTGLIVKKNSAGRWMDDNNGDWTSYISGTNAAFTGRIPGWDMPDHDLAVINTTNLSISYARGLMNICMATAVNPASGKISVIGTDAINQTRFTPVLNGIFVRVELGEVDPSSLTNTVVDLNPHLNYKTPQVSETERDMSIGDPRGIVWSSDGTRGYVTGMGSGNLIIIDAQGNRAGINPTINVGQGPTGLALDEGHNRLYVYNRFDDSISTVDTVGQTVVSTVQLFDPTPQVVKLGRPFLYNTHLTSGLGQLACGSCHVDARMDRLAWDLGDQTSTMAVIDSTFNFANNPPDPTNNFHPMKGPMTTLTLQDIIGHEPFHWRGDREGIEAFNQTFTNLQGMPDGGLTTNQMQEFKGFLSTVRFGPNPFRQIDNSLSTNLPIPGHFALGRGTLPAGAQLPNGNAVNGMNEFRTITAPDCIACHTLPAGLGTDRNFITNQWVSLPLSTNNSHHCALIELPRSDELPFKIPSLRNLFDKQGLDLSHTNSRAGFGLTHDGGVDTIERFLQDGVSVTNDQETADLVAFLLSFTGSDLIPGNVLDVNRSPGLPSQDTAASAGKQVTINNSNSVALINTMIALVTTGTNRVDLIVKGMKNGAARGWFYDTNSSTFLSDRPGESYTPAALRALAAVGSEQTYTLVPAGLGRRMGIDRDLDGILDGQLLLRGSSVTSNGASISCTSVVGLTYRLQYKNHLSDSTWSLIPGGLAGTGNTVSLIDTTMGTNQTRFYRVTTVE